MDALVASLAVESAPAILVTANPADRRLLTAGTAVKVVPIAPPGQVRAGSYAQEDLGEDSRDVPADADHRPMRYSGPVVVPTWGHNIGRLGPCAPTVARGRDG